MSPRRTRSANADKHPGMPDAPLKRRAAGVGKAEQKAKADQKISKKREEEERILRVARFEKTAKVNEDIIDGSPIPYQTPARPSPPDNATPALSTSPDLSDGRDHGKKTFVPSSTNSETDLFSAEDIEILETPKVKQRTSVVKPTKPATSTNRTTSMNRATSTSTRSYAQVTKSAAPTKAPMKAPMKVPNLPKRTVRKLTPVDEVVPDSAESVTESDSPAPTRPKPKAKPQKQESEESSDEVEIVEEVQKPKTKRAKNIDLRTKINERGENLEEGSEVDYRVSGQSMALKTSKAPKKILEGNNVMSMMDWVPKSTRGGQVDKGVSGGTGKASAGKVGGVKPAERRKRPQTEASDQEDQINSHIRVKVEAAPR